MPKSFSGIGSFVRPVLVTLVHVNFSKLICAQINCLIQMYWHFKFNWSVLGIFFFHVPLEGAHTCHLDNRWRRATDINSLYRSVLACQIEVQCITRAVKDHSLPPRHLSQKVIHHLKSLRLRISKSQFAFPAWLPHSRRSGSTAADGGSWCETRLRKTDPAQRSLGCESPQLARETVYAGQLVPGEKTTKAKWDKSHASW